MSRSPNGSTFDAVLGYLAHPCGMCGNDSKPPDTACHVCAERHLADRFGAHSWTRPRETQPTTRLNLSLAKSDRLMERHRATCTNPDCACRRMESDDAA